MSETRTVNQGWVKLNLPNKDSNTKIRTKKPDWIRVKLPIGKKYTQLRSTVEKNDLHTICVSGNCPNMGECWTEGTATFMILGNICTRSCGFCNVQTGSPLPADRSLEVLKYLKDNGINRTKSGLMLGLGETKEEVLETMEDLRKVGVDIITLGQYLQPTKKHLTVKDFITPEQFKEYEIIGKEMGFRHVESGPLVRSSYKAHKHIH